MKYLCECNFDEDNCNNHVTQEERDYLSEIENGLYYKDGYFIVSLECAEIEVENGDSIIIEKFGNSALTKWIGE